MTRVLNEDNTGRQLAMVDIFLDEEGLEDAYFHTIDLAEELADRVAFLSYAPATFDIISVTVPRVAVGTECVLAVPVEGFWRSRVKLDSEGIAQLDKKPADADSVALRMFSRGLSAASPYQVLTDLWTATEALAELEAREAHDLIEEKCNKCGDVRFTGRPASHRQIRTSYMKARPPEQAERDARNAADVTRGLRGKLVHGGKLHDAKLREQVERQIPSLQAATCAAMCRRLGIKVKSNRCQHLGMPYMALRMTAHGSDLSDVNLTADGFKVPAALSFLTEEFSDPQPFRIKIGLLGRPELHPLVLPEIV